MPKPATERFEFMGMSFPVTRPWAIFFGCLAMAIVLVTTASHVLPEWNSPVTLKQANAQLALDNAEYNKHIMDTPEKEVAFYDDARGRLVIRSYKDGCVLIFRKPADGEPVTKMIPDLVRSPKLARIGVSPFELGVAEAQGRCVAGLHAGQFNWHYGARNGAWVEVWRDFADGCQHVQMMNVQSGTWDSNADGSPRVRWTRCVH